MQVDTSNLPKAELASEGDSDERKQSENETFPMVTVAELEDIVRPNNVDH